jgi:hypothetical protein
MVDEDARRQVRVRLDRRRLAEHGLPQIDPRLTLVTPHRDSSFSGAKWTVLTKGCWLTAG